MAHAMHQKFAHVTPTIRATPAMFIHATESVPLLQMFVPPEASVLATILAPAILAGVALNANCPYVLAF